MQQLLIVWHKDTAPICPPGMGNHHPQPQFSALKELREQKVKKKLQSQNDIPGISPNFYGKGHKDWEGGVNSIIGSVTT